MHRSEIGLLQLYSPNGPKISLKGSKTHMLTRIKIILRIKNNIRMEFFAKYVLTKAKLQIGSFKVHNNIH